MLIYAHEERRHLPASPERVFAVVSDVEHHTELAGSGEVKAIHIVTEGPVRVGSEWTAEEEIVVGKSLEKFVARSTMREFDPPHRVSWTSLPPTKPVPRRIQWWYDLEPNADGGTDVRERVEVDFGPALNLLMKIPYMRLRAPAVAEGMRRTLKNLEARTSEPEPPAPA